LAKIEKAMRLGVQSTALNNLVDSLQKEWKTRRQRQSELLDLFDVYLVSGNVPPEFKNDLVRQGNLADLYRHNRNYTPSDILLEDADTGLACFRQRLGHLIDHLDCEDLRGDSELKSRRDSLRKVLESLDRLEKEAHLAEHDILGMLAARLRQQSIA
jgi:hypothetical protein